MTATKSTPPNDSTPTPRGPQDLALILERQRDVLRRLHAMGDRQSSLMATGEADDVLALTEQRQALVDELTELSRRADEAGATDAERASPRLRECLSEIVRLASEVASRDHADRAVLERRRNALADELAGLSTKERAASAYGPTGVRPGGDPGAAHAGDHPKFQDRRG